jgi:rod shape-determining protein MreD
MELLGVPPDWLLIWVVAWSVKRSFWQGALAGIILGLAQDGMTMAQPTHVWSLMVVGMLTARLQKQRFIQEDFISVALIVFAMAVVAETLMAIQFSLGGWGLFGSGIYPALVEVWQYHQQVALASAILSSLWAPVLYYPLNRWWELMNSLEQIPSR